MIKMLIELNEEKIKQEGIYSFEKMQQYIRDEIEAVGGRLDTDGWYTDGTWEGFGAVASVLEQTEWFLRYVKTWLWRNTDYEYNGNIHVEDLLQEVMAEIADTHDSHNCYENASARGICALCGRALYSTSAYRDLYGGE